MSVSLLSTTALSATTTLAGAMPASRNAWTTLGQKLSSGDMKSAQSAFSVYKRLISNAANNVDAQFTSNLNDLGTALLTNNLDSARSAYTAVSKDVASDPVLAIRNAAATAQETGSWISTMIGMGSSSGSSSSSAVSDPYAAILNTAYDRLNSSISSGSSSSDSYLQSAYGSSTTSNTDASSYLKLVYSASSTSSSSSTGSSSTSSLLDLFA
ncbi:MAG: hypothetical protein P4K83_06785 [Terracidiphilus sp.]|nr:hypothetical protein [Terracidiphilus sp.]